MTESDLHAAIDAAWDKRDEITPATGGPVRDAVETTLDALDSGRLRVAEKVDGAWHVHQWAKKAVLLSFRLNDMALIPGGPGDETPWFDKVPSKFAGWDAERFRAAGDERRPNVAQAAVGVFPGPERLVHRRIVQLLKPEPFLRQHQHRVHRAQDLADMRPVHLDIGGRDGAAAALHPDEGGDELDRVLGQHQHPVVGFQPAMAKEMRHPVGHPPQRVVAQRLFVLVDRDHVGLVAEARRLARQDLAHRAIGGRRRLVHVSLLPC